ncbi:O-antigen ligase family protein [uncultured Kordia sp.]|uniref:O-antigen ligase family protein n=1 Tax=uncultured Kordia sp. TaxID=507699 RepID=UPI00262821A7|nr:O-antigen ligase family protein [uncultured Kordia sp.]
MLKINQKSIFGLIFLLMVFLPNGKLLYVSQILFTLLAVFLGRNELRLHKAFGEYKLLVITSMFVTFVYTIIIGNGLYVSSLVKMINIAILIIFFPLINGYEFKDRLIVFSVSLILFSQLAFIFNIQSVTSFIDAYYSSENFRNWGEIVLQNDTLGNRSIFDLRFGGVFRNPNQCGRMLTLMLIVYLQGKKKLVKKHYLSLLIILCSIVLTGSRTTMIIFVLLISYFFLKEVKIKKKHLYTGISVALILVIFLGYKFNSRIFYLLSSTTAANEPGSLAVKYIFLWHYIADTFVNNILNLIFGTFNIDDIDIHVEGLKIYKFDAGVGYLLHAFGLLGLFSLLIFFLQMFVRASRSTKLFFILTIWVITSTILTNLRFSFLFMFMFGNYYKLKESTE